MNKSVLEIVLKYIQFDLVDGLAIEIRDCLSSLPEVMDFKLGVFDEKKYLVTIKLNSHNIVNIKKVFNDLLHFIEYTSTLYERKDYEDNVEYLLLSFTPKKTGFVCKILFEKDKSNKL